MEKILIIISLLLVISFVNAQELGIELTHTGYGSTPREVYIHISNTGDVTFTDIKILVDDQEYKTIDASLSPGKSMEDKIYLHPGEHTISVQAEKDGERIVDIITLNVPFQFVTTQKTTKENIISTDNKNIIWIASIAILIIVVLIWILTKKPKLQY